MKLRRYSRFANVVRSITFRSVMLAPVGDPFHRKNARAHPGKRDYNNRVHTRSLLFFMVLKPLRPNSRIFVRVSSALWRRPGRCDFLPLDFIPDVLTIYMIMYITSHPERDGISPTRGKGGKVDL